MLKQVSFLGNRDAFLDCPKSWRTRSIKSAASDRSRIVNDGLRPIWVAYSRSKRAPIAWNVPDHGRSTCWLPRAVAVIRFTRRIISSAARRVNVNSRIRYGSTPLTTRCATDGQGSSSSPSRRQQSPAARGRRAVFGWGRRAGTCHDAHGGGKGKQGGIAHLSSPVQS